MGRRIIACTEASNWKRQRLLLAWQCRARVEHANRSLSIMGVWCSSSSCRSSLSHDDSWVTGNSSSIDHQQCSHGLSSHAIYVITLAIITLSPSPLPHSNMSLSCPILTPFYLWYYCHYVHIFSFPCFHSVSAPQAIGINTDLLWLRLQFRKHAIWQFYKTERFRSRLRYWPSLANSTF